MDLTNMITPLKSTISSYGDEQFESDDEMQLIINA